MDQMAFTFRSPTLSGHIDEAEVMLFDAISVLGLKLPLLEWLDQQFYESPIVAREKVNALRNEGLTLMRALARDPSVLERVRARRPVAPATRAYEVQRALASLVAVCDDALESGAEVRCLSD